MVNVLPGILKSKQILYYILDFIVLLLKKCMKPREKEDILDAGTNIYIFCIFSHISPLLCKLLLAAWFNKKFCDLLLNTV